MIGTIVKALSGFYYVRTEDALYTCRARGKLRRDGSAPLVGDRVEIGLLGGTEGVVNAILPRKNSFARPAAANVDALVLLAASVNPVTDPFLIDRITAIAALKHCEVYIVLNKCDLDRADELYAIYDKAGFPTFRVSAKTGEGLTELKEALRGKLSVFTGNSGVGKSSLLNALQPGFSLSVGAVSEALGRGRHTTRHTEMYHLDFGADTIDTPGFSSLETEELSWELKQKLPECFVDFHPYLADCRFVGCSHTKEKGCAVLAAVKDGRIPRSRHQSYMRLYEELKPLKEWQQK